VNTITAEVPALAPNVPIRDGRRDLGGELVCPARERDGSRCTSESGMWSYAHLCDRHAAMLRVGAKVVLVNGTRLDGPAWTRATRLGLYVRPYACTSSTCEWCGSTDAEVGTVCPKAIRCPRCGAGTGQSCRRPSGHRAMQLHAQRIAAAERMSGQPGALLDSDPAGLRERVFEGVRHAS